MTRHTTTTTILAKAAIDQPLHAAIAHLFVEACVDRPHARAQDWREQLAMLLVWHGRGLVIDRLIDAVPSLSVRQAVALADMVERDESGVRHRATV